MQNLEYIACSSEEMDNMLYDCFPDRIVGARINEADKLIYFIDEDTGEMIYIEKVKTLLEAWIKRASYRSVNILDFSYDPARGILLLIKDEII